MTGTEAVTPVPAATVMVVRAGGGGLEVLMLERHLDSDFVGGALVFPGGKVDAADCALPPDRWDGLDPDVAAHHMGCDPGLALGLHVAAVRETFEEAGILFARCDGDPVGPVQVGSAAYRQARARLAAREEHWDWSGWLADNRLVLDLASLRWWAWWVTPAGAHRRFEARFFVAVLPSGQGASHDEVETTASFWVEPQAALASFRAGRASIVLPTRKNLEALAPFADPAALVAVAATRPPPTRVVPEVVTAADGTIRLRHSSFEGLEPA